MRFLPVLCVTLVASCAQGRAPAGDGGIAGSDASDLADAADVADADTCPGDPCSLLEQCGCGGQQVCDLDTSNLATAGTACRDVVVPGTEGANCSMDSQCAAGYSCFGAPGQCRRYCAADADCGTDAYCLIQVVFGSPSMPVPDTTLCTKACTPDAASDNGCPSAPQFGCRIIQNDPDGVAASGDEFLVTDCGKASASGTDGVDCATAGDAACAAGFSCFTITQGGNPVGDQCKQLCVFTVDGNPGSRLCGTGTCTQLTGDPFLVGTTEYGACL
jgi:hypothetical protein